LADVTGVEVGIPAVAFVTTGATGAGVEGEFLGLFTGVEPNPSQLKNDLFEAGVLLI